jgi:predicted nucleic acid-binding protein
LIAAVGEREGLVVAHYDEDYDRISAITGQPTRWVLPRGTA